MAAGLSLTRRGLGARASKVPTITEARLDNNHSDFITSLFATESGCSIALDMDKVRFSP